jgi:transcription antitermination protein NusB
MGKRRQGREIALQILYQIDSEPGLKNTSDRDNLILEHLKYFSISGVERDLAYMLADGVCNNLENLDNLIDQATENWTLDRLSLIDRNILRLAAYELKYISDIPFKTTINEAIEVAKRFGSDQSGKFVNGVLDRLHREIQLEKAPATHEQDSVDYP